MTYNSCWRAKGWCELAWLAPWLVHHRREVCPLPLELGVTLEGSTRPKFGEIYAGPAHRRPGGATPLEKQQPDQGITKNVSSDVIRARPRRSRTPSPRPYRHPSLPAPRLAPPARLEPHPPEEPALQPEPSPLPPTPQLLPCREGRYLPSAAIGRCTPRGSNGRTEYGGLAEPAPPRTATDRSSTPPPSRAERLRSSPGMCNRPPRSWRSCSAGTTAAASRRGAAPSSSTRRGRSQRCEWLQPGFAAAAVLSGAARRGARGSNCSRKRFPRGLCRTTRLRRLMAAAATAAGDLAAPAVRAHTCDRTSCFVESAGTRMLRLLVSGPTQMSKRRIRARARGSRRILVADEDAATMRQREARPRGATRRGEARDEAYKEN